MAPVITAIVKRTGDLVPFDREKIAVAIYKAAAAVGGHDRSITDRLTNDVVSALEATYSEEQPPTVEEIQDVVERVLILNGHAKTAKAYIVYRHERARLRAEKRVGRVENIPYKAMWHMLDWAVAHGCHTVDGLNHIIRSDRLPWLVEEADRRYEALLDEAAQAILERREELRFVIVAGPSSSGKTTTTVKIAERLARGGVKVRPLALDNYFFDLEHHPRDATGDYDFETPEALDLPLINAHLADLDRGEGIDVPTYDFKTGRRTESVSRFDPEPGELILLDTLHGLFPGLTEAVPAPRKLTVYIETVGQLKDRADRWVRWTDVRMLRRMVRDAAHRSYSPEKTILHWHYVRRSELKHIIPFQGTADLVINSSLAYELPFLKLRLLDPLRRFVVEWADEERRLDGWIRADRAHRLLDSVEDVTTDSAVPATSLLREFIGGSAYDVH